MSDRQRRVGILYSSPMAGTAQLAEAGGVPREWLLGASDLEGHGWTPVYCQSPSGPLGRVCRGHLWRVYQAVWACLDPRLDVVVAPTETAGLPAALARRLGLLRKPLLVQNVAMLRPRGRILTLLWRIAAPSVDLFASYASCHVARLAQRLGLPAHRSQALLAGVDAHFWTARDSSEPEVVDVLALGSNLAKDFPTVIEAMPPGRRLTVVTDPLNAAVIGDPAQGVRVLVDVHVAELRRLLAACELVAIPLRDVGASAGHLTLLAASAMGKPIVVTGADFVMDYVSSLVVATPAEGDVAAWREAFSETAATRPQVTSMPAVRTVDDWSKDLGSLLSGLVAAVDGPRSAP